jgi:hypothetical protein
MISAAVGMVFVIAVAILVIVAIHRLRLLLSDYRDYGDPFGDDAGAGVREPRRPPPTSGAAPALAEPDEYAA